MKKLIAGIVLIGALVMGTPALGETSCDLYMQYDYSKQLVIDMRENGTIAGSYIIENMDEADDFLQMVNEKTGSQLPMGTADKVLAIILPNPDGSFTMAIFGYLDGCQIGMAKVPWVL